MLLDIKIVLSQVNLSCFLESLLCTLAGLFTRQKQESLSNSTLLQKLKHIKTQNYVTKNYPKLQK